MKRSDLEWLLQLDGETYWIDPKGEYWVKFEVSRVEPNEHMPDGIKYSITLHGKGNERIIGYDNAHALKPKRKRFGAKRHVWDHRHFKNRTEPYEFDSPDQLLSDFWKDVDCILKEGGTS